MRDCASTDWHNGAQRGIILFGHLYFEKQEEKYVIYTEDD